jgi:hypothetical protein
MSSINNLYLYDRVTQLLINENNFCYCKGNAPMNLRPLKIHKGLDNTLNFRALDPDRNPVKLVDRQIYARIIDPQNSTIVLEKLCRLGTATGMIFLDLYEGDINDLHSGLYNMCLISTRNFVPNTVGEVMSSAIFTDTDSNVNMTLEISEQAFIAPLPTYSITNGTGQQPPYELGWTEFLLAWQGNMMTEAFYSGAIPGSRVKNHKDGLHTISIESNGFTGTIEIYGSLDPTPTPAIYPLSSLFRIWPSTLADHIDLNSFIGTEAYSFQANIMWLKIVCKPAPTDLTVTPVQELQKLTKILVRS